MMMARLIGPVEVVSALARTERENWKCKRTFCDFYVGPGLECVPEGTYHNQTIKKSFFSSMVSSLPFSDFHTGRGVVQ